MIPFPHVFALALVQAVADTIAIQSSTGTAGDTVPTLYITLGAITVNAGALLTLVFKAGAFTQRVVSMEADIEEFKTEVRTELTALRHRIQNLTEVAAFSGRRHGDSGPLEK